MKITRRNLLQITGFSILATVLLPRVAFAARNSLRSLRTGVQPGNKTPPNRAVVFYYFELI